MTISLQTNLPPGYLPPGIDPQSLDPAIRKQVETTGITLETAINLIGADVNDVNKGRLDALVRSLLPEPSGNGNKPTGDPLGNLEPETVSVDMYSVMALPPHCSQEMRSQAREVRNSEIDAQGISMKNAGQAIIKAVQDRLTLAIIQGSAQI